MVSPWRNRLARSAVNRKVGGSRPPGDVIVAFTNRGQIFVIFFSDYLFYESRLRHKLKCYFVAQLSCSPLTKIIVVTVISGFEIETKPVGPFALYRLLLTH